MLIQPETLEELSSNSLTGHGTHARACSWGSFESSGTMGQGTLETIQEVVHTRPPQSCPPAYKVLQISPGTLCDNTRDEALFIRDAFLDSPNMTGLS